MEFYDKVHLWIGTTYKSEAEYEQYFELDYSTEGDFDDPKYRVCEFCQDIGEQWFDQDFIIWGGSETDRDLDEILVEAAIDPVDFAAIKSICNRLGIEKAKAMFSYADAFLTIPVPYKENYNGLKYIGLFTGD